jgi:hypothetical protein
MNGVHLLSVVVYQLTVVLIVGMIFMAIVTEHDEHMGLRIDLEGLSIIFITGWKEIRVLFTIDSFHARYS